MTPADLFDAMNEHREERAAIMAESSVADPVRSSEEDRHRCEVAAILRWFYPTKGEAAAEYFSLVEKARGKAAADRLREDARAAWKQRRIDEAGQA